MPISPAKSRIFRRILFVLLLVASIILITAATFRLQSYLFARKVQSVLSRMGQIRLDKTSHAEILVLIPELKPGSRYLPSNQPDAGCLAEACYAIHIQNWPGGMIARMQAKLSYRFQWLFEAIYWLGHRYLLFTAYVEVRAGRVSRYEYSLGVECVNQPASDAVEVKVLGADRAGFPGYFGFMRDYDEIGDFGIRVPSNRPATSRYVAFTPDAQPEYARNAFDVHLDCLWNAQGCSATRQLLPLLWEQKMEPRN